MVLMGMIGATILISGYWLIATMFGTDSDERAPAHIGIYRDQLAEVDRDLERGVLNETDAETVRAEIGRRILAADRAGTGASGSGLGNLGSKIAVGLVVLALVGGFVVYSNLGAPGFQDLPLKDRFQAAEDARRDRPSQEDLEAELLANLPSATADQEFEALIVKLREVVAARPDDIQGLTLLAQNEARLGNLVAARRAQHQLVKVKGDAVEILDLQVLLDFSLRAADGLVTDYADRVLSNLLGLDPNNDVGQYVLGLMHYQTGRPDITFAVWRKLYENGPLDAPWVPGLEQALPELGQIAGAKYTFERRAGPTREDIEAAEQMTDEDRDTMVRGMVSGLAERLANEGGPAQDWARLISALGVLGESARATAIWKEAQVIFARNPDDLERVNSAAQNAGLSE